VCMTTFGNRFFVIGGISFSLTGSICVYCNKTKKFQNPAGEQT